MQNLNGRKGQATVELSVALILVMLLLVASVKTFVWINEKIVRRSRAYEATRVSAGQAPLQAVNVQPITSATTSQLELSGERMYNEPTEALNIIESPF
jgi:hypothetical protein